MGDDRYVVFSAAVRDLDRSLNPAADLDHDLHGPNVECRWIGFGAIAGSER